MLPSRSKRFASADGRVERLHLISPLQMGLVVLLLILLFALIFPRRSLLDELHRQERYDDLTLAYIDNLRLVDTGNDDLTILMTRARLDRIDYATIEASLKPIADGGDARLRILAVRVLAIASLNEMRHILVDFRGEESGFNRLRFHYTQIYSSGDERVLFDALPLWIETLLRMPLRRLKELPVLQAQVSEFFKISRIAQGLSERIKLASLALHAGMDVDAARLLATIDPAVLRRQFPDEAERALGYGQYDTAGMLYLLAREHAETVDEARERFRQGIDALMAGGLHAQAMASVDRHLGDLAQDSATLRYLTKVALAAGDPARAAGYARRLVFRPQGEAKR